jgi:hypothetical protein
LEIYRGTRVTIIIEKEESFNTKINLFIGVVTLKKLLRIILAGHVLKVTKKMAGTTGARTTGSTSMGTPFVLVII